MSCRQLRRWLSSRKRTRISANFKGSKPEQSHSQTRNQTESVQRSRSSPRQEGGATGVAMTTVSKSSTAPALLPTPPRRAQSAQSLSPPSLLPLPHPHHSSSTHVHLQSTGPLLPHPFQSPPGPGHTHNITSASPLLPHQSAHPSGHTHLQRQPYSYQQQPLPAPGHTPHASSLPAALQHLAGHTPSLLPHPSLQQAASYPQLAAANRNTWGGQSPQNSPALLPTPGSAVATPHHHPHPIPLELENPITAPKQKTKRMEITLTPSNCWNNFKFDREAIINSIHNFPVK